MLRKYVPYVERYLLGKSFTEPYQWGMHDFYEPCVSKIIRIYSNEPGTHLYVDIAINLDTWFYRDTRSEIFRILGTYFSLRPSQVTFTYFNQNFRDITGQNYYC